MLNGKLIYIKLEDTKISN